MHLHMPADLIGWRFLAPLLVAICNISIIRYLGKSSRFVKVNTCAMLRQIHENKITRMLIMITLCYALLILPSGIYFAMAPSIYVDFSDIVSRKNPVFLMILDILVLNHCVNYFLYILSAKRFRYESKLIFKTIWRTFISKFRSGDQSTSSFELSDPIT